MYLKIGVLVVALQMEYLRSNRVGLAILKVVSLYVVCLLLIYLLHNKCTAMN